MEKLLKEKYKSKLYKVEKKFFLINNPDLENFIHGKSWLIKSAKIFEIEIIPIDLTEEDQKKLLEIQNKQGELFKTNSNILDP